MNSTQNMLHKKWNEKTRVKKHFIFLLLTDKINVSSLRDFSLFCILLSTNILPLRGSPVRDLILVEKN